MSKFRETNTWLAIWRLNIKSDVNAWRISTDFTKIIVKHLHFMHRENETKLYVRKIFSLHRQKAPNIEFLRKSTCTCSCTNCRTAIKALIKLCPDSYAYGNSSDSCKNYYYVTQPRTKACHQAHWRKQLGYWYMSSLLMHVKTSGCALYYMYIKTKEIDAIACKKWRIVRSWLNQTFKSKSWYNYKRAICCKH